MVRTSRLEICAYLLALLVWGWLAIPGAGSLVGGSQDESLEEVAVQKLAPAGLPAPRAHSQEATNWVLGHVPSSSRCPSTRQATSNGFPSQSGRGLLILLRSCRT